MSEPRERERNDWEDRLVDRALQELHGDRPPDLCAATLQRLQPRRAPTISDGRRGGRLTASSLAAMTLAAAALVVAAIAWAMAPRSAPASERFEVAVVTGAITPITAAHGAASAPIGSGATAALWLGTGDRLRSSEQFATEVRIGPFGLLHTEPATTLEVIEMDVKTKNGWVTAGSLALAVVAGGASWHWIGMRSHAEAGEVVHLQATDESPTKAQLAAAAARTDDLQRENETLRQRVAALESAARTAEPIAPARPAAEPEAVDVATAEVADATGKPTFDDATFADVLNQLDWKTLGEVAAKMGLPLVELMKKLDAGEELPMELAVEISKLNMKLVEQLPKLMKAGLPGSGPNGAYTHPLVVANQLASLLDSGKLPLDATQRSTIAALVRGFTAEMTGIHDMQTELDLDRVVAEVTMKDRMYDDLARQLSPDQRALLYPDGAGNFDGSSLFRTGLVWQAFVAPVNARTPATYVEAASGRLTERLGLAGDALAQVRSILEQTAGAASTDVWAASSPVETAQGGRFLRSGRALRAAQLQQNWMRRILREVQLTPAQREQLRTMQQVIVPVPR